MKLPLPTDEAAVKAAAGTPILIYGGSTATGVLGIQYAKLSGFKVLTTASPRNFDYLRSLGADEVYDYNSDGWVEEVRKSTGGKLRHAWDCISLEASARGCAAALDTDPAAAPRYATLLPLDEAIVKAVNPAVDGPEFTLGYTSVGEAFNMLVDYPASADDYEHAKMFVALTEGLLAQGKIKPIKTEADRGGKDLEGVMVGIQELRDGKVSGSKLVYHM